MPPKRTYRRKARKAPLRKKVRKAAKKAQNTKVDAQLVCKTNYNMMIGTGGAGTVANYTLAYFTALGNVPSTGNPYNHFFDTTDFTSQAALYDEVCIKSYTIKYNPIVTQTTIYDQAAVIPATKQALIQPNIYSWIDRDATPLTAINNSYVNRLGMYDSFKQHNMYKKFSRRVALKPLWLPCSVVGSAIEVSAYTTQMSQAGLLGLFGIYGQNLPWSGFTSGNETFAQIEIHWSLQFRGKKAVGISVVDGVVTMTPAEKFAPIVPTLEGVNNSSDTGGQSLTLDISGNPIYVLP